MLAANATKSRNPPAMGERMPERLIDEKTAIAEARRDFAAYYATADVHEAKLFDELVIARVVMMIGISLQSLRPGPSTEDLQRGTNAAELAFMTTRDQVRTSSAFLVLPAVEQRRIEERLFNVSL